jgi:RNA polymerase sigma factor (sigma-70 family)
MRTTGKKQPTARFIAELPIVLAARRREPDAVLGLWLQYAPLWFKQIRTVTNSDPEEYMGVAFESFLRAVDKYDETMNVQFSSYCCRVIRNTLMTEHVRGRAPVVIPKNIWDKKGSEHTRGAISRASRSRPIEAVDWNARAKGSDPSAAMIRAEEMEEVQAAMRKIGLTTEVDTLLALIGGESRRGLAKASGCSHTAVRFRAGRARDRIIREIMAERRTA